MKLSLEKIDALENQLKLSGKENGNG